MSPKPVILFVILATVFLLGSQSFFIVDQREQAIVLQLGQPIGEPRMPGIHFKLPFVQNVSYFDRRVLPIDTRREQVVISSNITAQRTAKKKPAAHEETVETGIVPKIENVSGEPIFVETFARYKIIDPLQFMKTLRTTQNASSRIENILNDSTRAILGESTLTELLSSERAQIMEDIRTRVNEKIKQDQLGIEIVDVRIIRADLTDELRSSTVTRMRSALQERATEQRAKGEERALEIRSTAKKEKSVLIAEAQRDAQIIRGEGDKEAIKIYADAFNVDKDFYSFLRSMEAYRKTMANHETRLILSPDSEFFKHFHNNNNAP